MSMGNKQVKYESIPINEPMEAAESTIPLTFSLSQELASWPEFRCSDTEQHRAGKITDITIDVDYVKFTVAQRVFTIRRKLYEGVPDSAITTYLEQFADHYVNITYRSEYLLLSHKLLRPLKIEILPMLTKSFEITAIDNSLQDRTVLTVANSGFYNVVLSRNNPNYGELYKYVDVGAYVKTTSVNLHLNNNDFYTSVILIIEPAEEKDVMPCVTILITAFIHATNSSQYEIVGAYKGETLKKRYLVNIDLTKDLELPGQYRIQCKYIDNTWRKVLSVEKK